MGKRINSSQYWNDLGSDGKTYQMGPQPQRIRILDLLELHNCRSVLDVGCGTGPMYQLISEMKIPIKYKGVDYAKSFIETCKKEFPEGVWQVQDARKLYEGPNSFDAVLFLHSLDHIDNWYGALKDAKAIAQKVVIVCLWRPFMNTETKTNPDRLMTEFNKDELEMAFDELGYTIEDQFELDSEKYNYFYVLGAS